MELPICPSSLTPGYTTYSPEATKALFDGVTTSHMLPYPSPSSNTVEAKEAIKNSGRLSLSGAQPKFGLVTENGSFRYTNDGEQSTYILKPRPVALYILNPEFCAANENLTMQIAAQAYRIETAANGLCFFNDESMAYVTRRFDVHASGKYQQEDFASLMGLSKTNGGSDFKYLNGSYEECGNVISTHVKAARIDLLRFFQLVLFNFITLNDDAHLKNFSLINRNGEYRLSPAYDLMNTSLHLTNPRIFALDNGLFREGMDLSDVRQPEGKDFMEFGRRIGLPERLVKEEIARFSIENKTATELITRSFLSDHLKERYLDSMRYRQAMLRP